MEIFKQVTKIFEEVTEIFQKASEILEAATNYTQRKLFGILLIQTEIRLYLPFSD